MVDSPSAGQQLGRTPAGIQLRPVNDGDYDYVIARLNDWWDGRDVQPMLPRLFFTHFPATTTVAVDDSGRIAGFLCGLHSEANDDLFYIHFVGVDPDRRGQHIGALLYRWAFKTGVTLGCARVQAVTSPTNAGSRSFHRQLGFSEQLRPDYDGIGEDRIVLERRIGRTF